ncbi:MAG: Fpg/Nei family DNA glycosylase [Nitriliruptoraceae bacterium]
MPEGDTIHRIAARLRPVLRARPLTRVELPRVPPPHPTPGTSVTGVEARGKHLLVHTADALTIHTHLRMTGSWHLYRPGERWRKPTRAARVVLAVPGAVVVCFNAPIVEVLPTTSLGRHPALRALGPDLCEEAADLDEALHRLGAVGGGNTTIGEALLDQRVAAGIGNVYRCDVLFLHGVDPATPVAAVPTALRRALVEDAARLLRANLTTSTRTTAPSHGPGALWVHGRAGQPCRRCGTPIEVAPLGDQARLAYRCPRCQPAHQAPRHQA